MDQRIELDTIEKLVDLRLKDQKKYDEYIKAFAVVCKDIFKAVSEALKELEEGDSFVNRI